MGNNKQLRSPLSCKVYKNGVLVKSERNRNVGVFQTKYEVGVVNLTFTRTDEETKDLIDFKSSGTETTIKVLNGSKIVRRKTTVTITEQAALSLYNAIHHYFLEVKRRQNLQENIDNNGN